MLFLFLAWRCNLTIINSQVECQTSCLHIILKKTLVKISIKSGGRGVGEI
jgi:hypothetical protein